MTPFLHPRYVTIATGIKGKMELRAHRCWLAANSFQFWPLKRCRWTEFFEYLFVFFTSLCASVLYSEIWLEYFFILNSLANGSCSFFFILRILFGNGKLFKIMAWLLLLLAQCCKLILSNEWIAVLCFPQ